MSIEAVKWAGGIDGFLEAIDQRLLPGEFRKLKLTSVEEVKEAIKTLAIRGAPAIGVAAGYGLVIGLQKLSADMDIKEAGKKLDEYCQYLASARPTAVNLFWALERIRKNADRRNDVKTLCQSVLKEADAIYNEDVEMCRRIGENGQKFVSSDCRILTHCNAGALATAGQGTALSVIFEAQKVGKKLKVYADETRPLLQGARLTAWELQQAGLDVTIICDNAAGWLMKQGKIDMVITGADRIAANGDSANKIGTYSLSILAKEHGVPFYIAAPSSTFDLSIPDGGHIPIEERAAHEVTMFAKTQIAPDGIGVYNPAFDVTPASHIKAIINEKGVIENPNKEKIAACLGK